MMLCAVELSSTTVLVIPGDVHSCPWSDIARLQQGRVNQEPRVDPLPVLQVLENAHHAAGLSALLRARWVTVGRLGASRFADRAGSAVDAMRMAPGPSLVAGPKAEA